MKPKLYLFISQLNVAINSSSVKQSNQIVRILIQQTIKSRRSYKIRRLEDIFFVVIFGMQILQLFNIFNDIVC